MNQVLSMMGQRHFPLSRRMSHWVDQVIGQGYSKYCTGDGWTPAVNLYEEPGQYCVVADLAGVSPEQVDLHADNGVLVLRGERAVPQLPEGCVATRVHLMEIDHGRFCREIELPGDVDVDRISASYKNGYLWVRLPKKNA